MARTRHQPDPSAPLPAELTVDRPKGDQLREILEELVGSLRPGVLLPSERVLAERYGVARMTVRQELDRLAADGLVVRRARHGTFVAEPTLTPVDLTTSFSDRMRERGLVPGARVLTALVEPATARWAHRLEVPVGAPVLRLVRLRTADGEPMALERTHLSVRRFPGIGDLDWTDRSLHGELERRWSVRVDSIRARISAVLPDPEDARVLGIGVDQPCFTIEGTPRDACGVVIEAGRSLYRGDRYDVVTQVRRVT